MVKHHRLGAAIAITRDMRLIWHGEYGVSSVEGGAPVTTETVFPVCSLSKPVLLVAVMREMARRARDQGVTISAMLDHDINDLIRATEGPVSVRHPDWPYVAITLRMVLAHVSGIRDSYVRVPHHLGVAPPMWSYRGPNLAAALKDYFNVIPGGGHRLDSWGARPGVVESYSSVGTSLAALVVESPGRTFEDETEARVFRSLGMAHTHWRVSAFAGALPATGYRWIAGVNRPVEGPVEHVFYPAASLRSTAVDYARFVAALAGQQGESQILDSESAREILRPQFPAISKSRGLILELKSRDGVPTAGHDGQNEGYRSSMFYTMPPRGEPTYGVVILTNGDSEVDNQPMETLLGEELLHRARLGTL